MGHCFVMQPFDRGKFDKRYDGVVEPAIKAAGFEPYRVDRDPGVSIPVDHIEEGIRNAEVCVAEITLDNPNVWFELGYAIACGQEVVLLCSSERTTNFPFDVQHRHIITYKPDSPGDFDELKSKITARLKAIREKQQQIVRLTASPVIATQGLTAHEIVALIVVAQGSYGDPPSFFSIKKDMFQAGYTEIAAVIAMKRLEKAGLVATTSSTDFGGDPYLGFELTSGGTEWLMENESSLTLKLDVFGDFVVPSDENEDLPF